MQHVSSAKPKEITLIDILCPGQIAEAIPQNLTNRFLMTKVCEDVINAVAKFDLLLVKCRLGTYKKLTFVCAPYNCRTSIHFHGDVCLRVKSSDSIKIPSENEIFRVVKMCVLHAYSMAFLRRFDKRACATSSSGTGNELSAIGNSLSIL